MLRSRCREQWRPTSLHALASPALCFCVSALCPDYASNTCEQYTSLSPGQDTKADLESRPSSSRASLRPCYAGGRWSSPPWSQVSSWVHVKVTHVEPGAYTLMSDCNLTSGCLWLKLGLPFVVEVDKQLARNNFTETGSRSTRSCSSRSGLAAWDTILDPSQEPWVSVPCRFDK